IAQCRATGRPFVAEYRAHHREGRLVWIRDEARVVRADTGEPLCLQGVMQDVTDRRRVEGQLADGQALARVGTWEWDVVADRLMWSDEHYRIFGLEPQSCPVTLGMILQYVVPGDRSAVQDYATDVRAGVLRNIIEYRIHRADGAERVLEARAKTDVDATGRPARMFGTVQDVTDRKRAEENFEAILEFASVGFFRSTRHGRILLANPAFAAMLGYESPIQVYALDLARDVYLDPKQRERLVSEYEASSSPWTLELLWKKRDGSPFWVLLSAHAVHDDSGRTRYFDSFVQDVTARREAQQELARSRRQLREFAARQDAVREMERKVVAREIHDELGQSLTALRMDLARMRQLLPSDASNLATRTDVMTGVVDHLIDTVRRIATELRPPILDDLGLVAAIEWQAEEVAGRAGLRCALDLPADVRLDDARATAVFRICQEALTNVARHARASTLRVALLAQPTQLVLQVTDDGRGITDAELADPGAIGLTGMRERAIAVGGTLDVFPVSPSGTCVTLRLPLGADPVGAPSW
ncbi:MAG TPA: PAS domain S-box protein, partial [Gemmatimonadales bacterium]|nr:PAS domain S-box protein [Gemmatimonadales bacterium]